MNNVSQKVYNFECIPKDVADQKSIVLLICTIFLVTQVFELLFLSHSSSHIFAQLDVLPNDDLTVSSFTSSDYNSKSQNVFDLDSQTLYHLTPFFFKPIPINYCDKVLLMSIRGIGPNLAERIIRARDAKKSFADPNELLAIKGIGPGRLQKIKPYLNFSKNHDSM